MVNSINGRLIKELVQGRELTSYAIAKALDVGVATVDNWIKGKKQKDGTYKLLEPSREYINKLCSIYGLDKEYIIDGIVNTNKFAQRKGVPVLNTDYTASDVTQYDDEVEKVIGYVDLEGFRKCKWIVRVKGPSMEPDFKTGDFIGLEPVENFKIIEYGQPYAITTKSKQKLIKQIKKGKDNDNLILRSKNPDFDDIDLHKDEISKLFKVHGPIRDVWQ